MKLTSDLFVDFLKCPTKCYLRSTGQVGTGNAYAEWVREQNDAYRAEAARRLMEAVPGSERTVDPACGANLKTAVWRLAVDLPVETETMASRLHAVERLPSQGRGKPAQFIPVRFSVFNKLTKDDTLLVAFDSLVLSEALGREIAVGRIIHGDDRATLQVKVAPRLGTVRTFAGKMSALLAGVMPPDLILNRHCGECEFRDGCRQRAREKDDLSLLGGMTEKERKKYHSKGIFTVTQLSYTFRPRRRPKRLRGRPERYDHALKALAIREKKILIVGSPELKIQGTPIFLDVEGLPDRDLYFLIGVRKMGDASAQHSLWADKPGDEVTIWRELLNILKTTDRPILIHYGNYERTFLKCMQSRYGTLREGSALSNSINSSVNLLSTLYARVYWPTHGNRLKDIAVLTGAAWRTPDASGLNAIAWRLEWERTHDAVLKDKLIAYNQDDCNALGTLTNETLGLFSHGGTRPDVDFADARKTSLSERGASVHENFRQVLRSAYSDYGKARIAIGKTLSPAEAPVRAKRPTGERRYLSTVKARIVRVPRKRKCQRHLDHPTLLRPQRKLAMHPLLDLIFTRKGCHKSIVNYVGVKGRCPYCNQTYPPPFVKQIRNQTYGSGFYAWVIYLRVALRLSYRLLTKATWDLFHTDLSEQTAEGFLHRWSQKYRPTEKAILKRILQRPTVHVDETKLNIVGHQQYVWVLTDGQWTVFRLTEGREADFLSVMLAGYHGTVVSDFYGGYDALPFRQQKCLVHLIGDLNDDLWKHPFNTEFEEFVARVRDLLLPILTDVQRYGLRAYHLRKHRHRVERFYGDVIAPAPSSQELLAKYRKRFIRYRESLFTFLEADGVPWNNNAAERALGTLLSRERYPERLRAREPTTTSGC